MPMIWICICKFMTVYVCEHVYRLLLSTRSGFKVLFWRIPPCTRLNAYETPKRSEELDLVVWCCMNAGMAGLHKAHRNTTRTCSSSPHATSRAFIWHEQYKIVVTLLFHYVYLDSLSFTGTFAYLCYSAYWNCKIISYQHFEWKHSSVWPDSM